MADRRLILMRDASVPPPGKMHEEIATAVIRALFQPPSTAVVWIMNARRNAQGTITAITHPNTTADMALLYRDIIIKAGRSVYKWIIDVEGNVNGKNLKSTQSG
jgi:hypothetical protein